MAFSSPFKVALYLKENINPNIPLVEFVMRHSPVSTHDISELPERLMKLYRYAVRFVELVRCKTPKVLPKADFFLFLIPSVR
jgi:acyl carrier protein phosphodiesterase